jgi:hypothetical protein
LKLGLWVFEIWVREKRSGSDGDGEEGGGGAEGEAGVAGVRGFGPGAGVHGHEHGLRKPPVAGECDEGDPPRGGARGHVSGYRGHVRATPERDHGRTGTEFTDLANSRTLGYGRTMETKL